MFTNLIMPLAAVLLLGTGTAFAESSDKPSADRPSHESPIADIDTDKDGAVSTEESSAHAAKKFDEIDTDKDGFASMEEMSKYRSAERAARAHEAKSKYQKKVDPDGDGKITRDEFMKNAAERHSKNDTNADGKVTKEEVKARFDGHRKGGEGPSEHRGEMKPSAGNAAPVAPEAE